MDHKKSIDIGWHSGSIHSFSLGCSKRGVFRSLIRIWSHLASPQLNWILSKKYYAQSTAVDILIAVFYIVYSKSTKGLSVLHSLQPPRPAASRISIQVVIKLYFRGVWHHMSRSSRKEEASYSKWLILAKRQGCVHQGQSSLERVIFKNAW